MKIMKVAKKLSVGAISLLLGLSTFSSLPNIHADTSSEQGYTYVNNDKSTLSRHWGYDHIHYARLDSLNRAGTDTAYLAHKNLANDSLRQEQDVRPTGWHQKRVNGEYILNRGHEIAYSLSRGITSTGKYSGSDDAGDQNNPRNLFTQTQYSNQDVQTIFESEVRNALENNEKVVYRVKPIFSGDDLMAKSVQLQAKSTDGSLNFNVDIRNTQPNVTFDYSDGTSAVNGDAQTENNYDNQRWHSYDNDNYYYSHYHRPYDYNYSNHGYNSYYRPHYYHYSNNNYSNDNNGSSYNSYSTPYHHYSHGWSPMARSHWYNTMKNRYWR